MSTMLIPSRPVGLLRAHAAVGLNTANAPAAQEQALLGDPLKALRYQAVFPKCGVANVQREVFAVVAAGTAKQRAAWLERLRALMASVFPRG